MINDSRIRLLVTGFGPFPGVRVNPTARLAVMAAQSRRFARLGVAVEAHVFSTRWSAVARDLPPLIARLAPDAALHLGVAAKRRRVCVETVARPSPSMLAPDAGGATAPRRPGASASRAFAIAASTGPLLASFRRAGAAARLSNDAGRYLCNAVYHQSLSLRAAGRDPRPTVFVHVPMPGAPRSTIPVARMRTIKPSTQATLRGVENALLALALAARAQRAAARRSSAV
jgi:pyroglutamyl-peptidase